MSLLQMHVVALLVVLLTTGLGLAEGRWSQMKPIPQGEEEVVGVAVDGRMYVLGGLGAFPGWEPKQIFFRYDPAANEWSKLPSLPEGVHHPGVAAVGDKIYVMGGFTISRPTGGGLPAWVPTSSVWVFDLAANAWSKGVPVPTPRGALTTTAVGTKIYAIGGARNPSHSTPELRPPVPVANLATHEALDTATGTWAPPRPIVTARHHHRP